jgi:hypothetical protein
MVWIAHPVDQDRGGSDQKIKKGRENQIYWLHFEYPKQKCQESKRYGKENPEGSFHTRRQHPYAVFTPQVDEFAT